MDGQVVKLSNSDTTGSNHSAPLASSAYSPIIYEQPLNERIRTFLRLEFLFQQARSHLFRHSAWDSRAAINTLFDIVNIFSRSDLKTEVMKELERQAGFLERLAENPQVDTSRLEDILNDIDLLIDRLYAANNQSFDLRGNELLNSIKQRSSIAGGCCDFDLPAYHLWLSQPEEKRIIDIQKWIEPFEPIQEAIKLIMRLIRESAQPRNEIAEGGFFQLNLDPSAITQMIRVTLDSGQPYYAEISGGKHRITIRFMESYIYERPKQTSLNVPFRLYCCTL